MEENKKIKFDKKKIPLLIAIVITLILSVFMIKNTFSTGINASESIREGYTSIKDVTGVEFYLYSTVKDSATAVAHISNKVNFATNMYYTYKDTSRYLLFNMNGLVLIAEKGTSFDFANASDMEDALKRGSICGIHFEIPEEGASFSRKGNRTSANVNAEVVITNTLYGDFCGVLSSVTDGEEEWSIFAGVVGDDVTEIKDGTYDQLSYMANSIKVVKAATTIAQDAYAVEIGSVEKESVSLVEKTDEDEKGGTDEEDKGMDISNQEEIIKVDTKAYSSNIYSMLNIGDKGICQALNTSEMIFEEPIIDITGILSGTDAVNYLKALYKDEYLEPSEGCAYHVITYNLYYKTCSGTPYVNIKLRGLDGSNLKFRGIQYSKKTHDYTGYVSEKDDWNVNYVCYYEVPNGCTEYVLECGDGEVSREGTMAAYYLIKLNSGRDASEEESNGVSEGGMGKAEYIEEDSGEDSSNIVHSVVIP